MSITGQQLITTGLGDSPTQIQFFRTNDTLATVTAAGYLSQQLGSQVNQLSIYQIAVVYCTDVGTVMLQVTFVGGVWSLASTGADGVVATPTTANQLAYATNTGGALGASGISVAFNAGSIYAGLSGTAGTLRSYPSAATEGYLALAAVSNSSGNFATTISNASSVGQAQVISIPDSGTSASTFLIADSAGTQTIATGNLTMTLGNFLVSAGTITAAEGNIQAGSSGHAGILKSYSATGTKGYLALAGVANTGNTATTISNDAMGQASVVNIPDPGNATGQFLVGATATPFTSGNIPKASGTGGLMVDSGITAASLTAGSTVVLKTGTLTSANLQAMYGTPVSILAAPANGTAYVVHRFEIEYVYVTTAYATNAGSILLTYGSSAHAAANVATGSIACTGLTDQTASTCSATAGAMTGLANTAIAATALYISNTVGALTTGDGTASYNLWYSIITL